MKLITSTDLKHWAATIESKNLLPLLIRKLILAGVKLDHLKKIDFPFGDDVYTGGYDGDLESEEGNLYIPTGNSVWEFGVTERKKEKANRDYEKRKKDPLGKLPSETTYIQVTLKKYTKKTEWADEKNEEGFWADVRFYDAIDLEHWLELAPSVELWLARLLRKPVSGIQCGEDYWEQWSTKGSLKFPNGLLVDSRESQKTSLLETLKENKGQIQYVKANTKEESLAFILATIESQKAELKESLHTKTLVIENYESFRQLAENKDSLILIPKYRIEDVDINAALNKGHKVIIPVSNSYTSKKVDLITLPAIKGAVFRENLQKIGINREQAQLLAKNTGKDVSVLRRSLDFSSKRPAWLEYDDPILFIPFLLLARFDSSVKGDQEIVEKFTGISSDKNEKTLKKILHYDETPIYNVGAKWRLISHSDSWLYLGKFITQEDLNKFYDVAVEVLSETNPKYMLDPEKRYMASFYNAKPKYSVYLKKGICETLIVLSVLAKKYDLDSTINPENYVNKIVNHILSLSDKNLLRSHSGNLALLAEASPEIFISQLEKHIEEGETLAFFEEEKGILNRTNDLPYLLRALEGIAWMPEYLTKVVRILAKLIDLAPKELPTLNTPFNTLLSIFRIWYPQTNANTDERIQVLEILKNEYPKIAFSLLNSLVYSHSDHASMNGKMRWRLFSETREVSVTRQEVQFMHDYSVNGMIELAAGDFNKINVLITKLPDINWTKLEPLLNCIQAFEDESESNKAVIYHSLRKIIGNHRTHSKQNWSLPESMLVKVEKVALRFEPKDTILAKFYFFDDGRPIPIQGFNEDIKKDYRQREEDLSQTRKDIAAKIYEEYGIKKIIELSKNLENPFYYARAVAMAGVKKKDEIQIYDLLKSDDSKEKWFLKSYISSMERCHDRKKLLKEFETLLSGKKYSDLQITDFLFGLFANLELFEYVDSLNNDAIKEAFWLKQDNWMSNDSKTIIHAVEKFLEFKRPITALNLLGRVNEDDGLKTDFIVEKLQDLDLTKSNEPETVRVDHYPVRKIFEDLQKRDDVDEEKMAEMEFKFLFVFDRFGHGILPRFLYKALAKDPAAYMEIIKSCYVPKKEIGKEKSLTQIEKGNQRLVFENAYSILSNFNLIPGLQEDGSIVENDLNKWVNSLRKLAETSDKLEITDEKIGELLARYPNGDKPMFFTKEIYDILERINSKSIKQGFSIQVFNRMGATSRMPESGGNIERARAELFHNLFEQVKITHPNVAEIFSRLAKGFEHDAKLEDIEALHNTLEY